eukprot:14877314-Ditylum_brightwellii.AAC.1
MHADNANLVLNPQTRHVLPQYHVTFDNIFLMVSHLQTGIVPALWQDLVTSNGMDIKEPLLGSTWELSDNYVELPKSFGAPVLAKLHTEDLSLPLEPSVN